MEIKISYGGPIFGSSSAAQVKQAIEQTIRDITLEGERDVVLQLYPGHGLLTGHYRRSIHGDVVNSLDGRIHDSGVVYGGWLEGVSSRNQRTRFKGYFAFRNAMQRLQGKAQGILQANINRLVGKLNG